MQKTSDAFCRIKDLFVISKIMEQLDEQMGVTSKTLAEFIYDLIKKSKSVMDFENKLKENDADIPNDIVNSLYAQITKLIP